VSDAMARVGPLRRVGRPRADVSGTRPATPLVAVLCAPSHARTSASGVALALAGAGLRGPALASAVGSVPRTAGGGAPAARRMAGRLRACGLPATAAGRLVWLAGGRIEQRGAAGDGIGIEAGATGGGRADEAGVAAAAAVALGRAVAVVAAPAALALPFARTAALDRVLAWHDAIVVVREPDATDALWKQAMTSLARLGRPIASMAPPPRIGAALAAGGMLAPAEAVRAVAQLGFGGGR